MWEKKRDTVGDSEGERAVPSVTNGIFQDSFLSPVHVVPEVSDVLSLIR